MPWSNIHTHTAYCDGSAPPAAFAEEALRLGMISLGFSSHAPVPFSTDWTMPPENLEPYLRDIRTLKAQYAGKLDIFLGLEIDYIPAVTGPALSAFKSIGLDYAIGSIHFVGALPGGEPWAVDGDCQSFEAGLRDAHGGDIRRIVETYYENLAEMVRTETPDVVGHFDLIKKNNPKEIHFSESAAWYREAALGALEVVAATGIPMEVNTGGLSRKKIDSLYPSDWILRQCLEKNIPIVLTSDAHRPEHLTAGFAAAACHLADLGFREQRILTLEGWRTIPLASDPPGHVTS